MWTLSLLGFYFSIVGLISLLRNHIKILLFCLLWIIVPLFFYGNIYSITARFFVVLLPPFFILEGCAFSRLISVNRLFRLITAILFLSIVYSNIYMIGKPLLSRHTQALLPDFATWVGEVTEPNALIISGDDGAFFEYYAHRHCLNKPRQVFDIDGQTLQAFKKDLDDHLNQNIPVYITSVGLYAYDPERKISTMIKENYDLEFIGQLPYEDWHRDALRQLILDVNLFKINKK